MVSGRYQYVFRVTHDYNIPEEQRKQHKDDDAVFYSIDGDTPWLDDDVVGNYYETIATEMDSRYGSVYGGASTTVSIIATYDNLTGERLSFNGD